MMVGIEKDAGCNKQNWWGDGSTICPALKNYLTSLGGMLSLLLTRTYCTIQASLIQAWHPYMATLGLEHSLINKQSSFWTRSCWNLRQFFVQIGHFTA